MVRHYLMRVCVYACMRVPVHACMYVEVNRHFGTIHQLSTCNQRFGGLMTVCY